MTTNTTVERISASDRTIYTATMAIITSMKDGDNKSITDLTDEVSETVSREASEIKPFVSHFAKATEEDGIGYVAPGRFGGYRKGARPAKTVKATTKSTKTKDTDSN